jgi:hypothetical protein
MTSFDDININLIIDSGIEYYSARRAVSINTIPKNIIGKNNFYIHYPNKLFYDKICYNHNYDMWYSDLNYYQFLDLKDKEGIFFKIIGDSEFNVINTFLSELRKISIYNSQKWETCSVNILAAIFRDIAFNTKLKHFSLIVGLVATTYPYLISKQTSILGSYFPKSFNINDNLENLKKMKTINDILE